ncbi:MAG: hypothetical protein CSA26_02800 [Desulfobacterales bacterium]|nr:MAG: hypothetical protein CSA26_02800 [Desulfobacterales bacterium]
MFTLTDIKNVAIQIEKNGEKTYREAAEKAADPAISKVLHRMADDEKRHAAWLAAIPVTKETTEEQRELEAAGKTILQEMVRDKTFSLDAEKLADSADLKELFSQSLGFEEDTILFYEMLSSFIEDEEAQKKFALILEEEKSHCLELELLLADT